eukprot:SM000041S15562  [mRNA]  locus=s41:679270:680112:- [translate_table: standard]
MRLATSSRKPSMPCREGQRRGSERREGAGRRERTREGGRSAKRTSSSMSHIMRVRARCPRKPRSRYASSTALQSGTTSSAGTQASSGSASAHRFWLKKPPTRRLKPKTPSFSAGMYARSLMCGCSNRLVMERLPLPPAMMPCVHDLVQVHSGQRVAHAIADIVHAALDRRQAHLQVVAQFQRAAI